MSAVRRIARPQAEVFEFFSNAENNPLWQRGMRSCQWTSAPPIGVGSTYEQVARFMGRDIVSVFEVTRYEPGSLIEIETTASTFPIQVRREVEALPDGGSEVRATISGGPERGLLKWIEPLAGRRAQKSVDADYDRLVQVLEANSA